MKRHSLGFSLLELLVALSIMALSLGLLYRSMGGSARQAGAMEMQQRAVMVARSVLASREAVTAAGWNAEGQDGDFVWRVQSQPFAGGSTDPRAVRLHEVTVLVERGDDVRPIRLEFSTLLPERRPFPGEVAR